MSVRLFLGAELRIILSNWWFHFDTIHFCCFFLLEFLLLLKFRIESFSNQIHIFSFARIHFGKTEQWFELNETGLEAHNEHTSKNYIYLRKKKSNVKRRREKKWKKGEKCWYWKQNDGVRESSQKATRQDFQQKLERNKGMNVNWKA